MLGDQRWIGTDRQRVRSYCRTANAKQIAHNDKSVALTQIGAAAVNVDEPGEQIGEDVLTAIRAVKPVKAVWLVRV